MLRREELCVVMLLWYVPMEDPAGSVEDHMWEGRLASRMVVS